MPENSGLRAKRTKDDVQAQDMPDGNMTVADLEALRAEIDRIDSSIAELLNERIRLIRQVVEIKERLDLPTLDSEREKQVLARVCASVSDPEAIKLIEALYEKLFQLSREYQAAVRQRMK